VHAVAVGNLGPRASTEVVWAKAGKTAKAAANNHNFIIIIIIIIRVVAKTNIACIFQCSALKL
jgi:hypothetical protein